MAALKGGRVSDFADSMAEAIEQAMAEEWQALKGSGLPAEGREDRRLLFVAIARGVLKYLKAHEAEVLTAITLDGGAGPVASTVTDLEINYSDG